VAAIQAAGGTAEFQLTDVSSDEDCRQMVEAAVAHFGSLHILVNNAAAFVYGRVEDADTDDWNQVLGVNVVGPALCVKHALPELRRAGGGSIVNIASVSGFIAQPAFVPYNSSKAALLHMTRCLAMDLAVDNVRVNAICPGAIRTRATEGHIRSQGLDRDLAYAEFAAAAVMKRMGQPIEIAHAALFLASDEASFVTGAHLVVDGGATLD
jgi:NAD(P)-dependent dehydrogenase (short-subunit alcohol dehydrogenase family)